MKKLLYIILPLLGLLVCCRGARTTGGDALTYQNGDVTSWPSDAGAIAFDDASVTFVNHGKIGSEYPYPLDSGFMHITNGAPDLYARAVNLATSDVTGILTLANGGLGINDAGTNGQVLGTNGTTLGWVTPAAGATIPTGSGFYHVTGGVEDPAARAVNLSSGDVTGSISLTSQVTGTLPITNGGTGISTAGSNGQVLTTNGTTASWQTPSSGGGVSGLTQNDILYGSADGGIAQDNSVFYNPSTKVFNVGATAATWTLECGGSVTDCVIGQPGTISSGNGAPLDLSAETTTASAGTGGNVRINAGTGGGSGAPGEIQFNLGGTTIASFAYDSNTSSIATLNIAPNGGYTEFDIGQASASAGSGPGIPFKIYGQPATSGTGGELYLLGGNAIGTGGVGGEAFVSGGIGSGTGGAAVVQGGAGGSSNGGNASLTGGNSAFSTGGEVLINSGSGDGGAGGLINIQSGGSNANAAGTIYVQGGTSISSYGGSIDLTAGNGGLTGGTVSLTGGNATVSGHPGGSVGLTGGNGDGSGASGNVSITGGLSAGTGLPGSVTVTGGQGSTGTGGGTVTVAGGTPEGLISITGGPGSGASGTGGNVSITGGTVHSLSGTPTAGNVNITGGFGATAAGAGGSVNISAGGGGNGSQYGTILMSYYDGSNAINVDPGNSNGARGVKITGALLGDDSQSCPLELGVSASHSIGGITGTVTLVSNEYQNQVVRFTGTPSSGTLAIVLPAIVGNATGYSMFLDFTQATMTSVTAMTVQIGSSSTHTMLTPHASGVYLVMSNGSSSAPTVALIPPG